MKKQQLPYIEIAKACGLSETKDLITNVESLVIDCYSSKLLQCRIDQ